MRWSKSILKKEQAEKRTLEFTPQKFKLQTPSQALDYLKEKKVGSDFRMNDVLRVQTGVESLEQKTEEQKVDEKTLEKLQMVQESAYAEAYRLGMDEGKKNAFEKTSTDIQERLGELDQLLASIRSLKTELAGHNEASLMGLMFQMASRVAMSELDQNNQALIEVLRQAVHLAQDEERIHVQVAPSQYEFLEEIKKQTGREYDFLNVMTFDSSPAIRVGGCVIETNYGEIDARVEQRLAQLWAAINPNLPRVKNVIGG